MQDSEVSSWTYLVAFKTIYLWNNSYFTASCMIGQIVSNTLNFLYIDVQIHIQHGRVTWGEECDAGIGPVLPHLVG